MLEIKGIEKSFGKRKVLKGISLQLRRGEIVGLLGPNGAGKTTTFKIILGELKADRGRIFLNREEITYLPMYQRVRKGIGFLPQESSVFRRLSAEENLYAYLEFRCNSWGEVTLKAEDLMRRFGIYQLRKQKAYSLSGGERRRLEIARALALEPSFLLLDEPFTGIDPIAIKEIQRAVLELRREGIGILITDHNVRETLKITDRAYIITNGEIFAAGSPEELASNEEVKRKYLGERFVLQ